jgi:uncharacterized Rmd1/YagE family protein
MEALIRLKKQLEIDYLKTKSYEEINEMFNLLNDKINSYKNIDDILNCIATYDKEASLEEKGRYFEIIQKDVIKSLTLKDK